MTSAVVRAPTATQKAPRTLRVWHLAGGDREGSSGLTQHSGPQGPQEKQQREQRPTGKVKHNVKVNSEAGSRGHLACQEETLKGLLMS